MLWVLCVSTVVVAALVLVLLVVVVVGSRGGCGGAGCLFSPTKTKTWDGFPGFGQLRSGFRTPRRSLVMSWRLSGNKSYMAMDFNKIFFGGHHNSIRWGFMSTNHF